MMIRGEGMQFHFTDSVLIYQCNLFVMIPLEADRNRKRCSPRSLTRKEGRRGKKENREIDCSRQKSIG